MDQFHGLSEAEITEALDRVLNSDAFRRSRRLQQFLRYIVALTLDGNDARINEYLIGSEVFDRGEDYNPSDDSVVRRQAHSLRQKLAEYYSTQGRDDPVEIEVPRGHYVPTFRPNPRFKQHELDSATPGAVPEHRREAIRLANQPTPRLDALLLVSAVLITGVLAFWLGSSTGGSTRAAAPLSAMTAPAVKELWGSWLTSGQAPLIAFSSPHTGVVKHFSESLPPGAVPQRTLLTGEMEQRFRDDFDFASDGYLYISPSVTQTKSGESLSAVRLANLFAANGLPAQATLSRLLNWDKFREENLILLGHNEQNEWIDPLLAEYPFQLEATSGSHQRRIVNRDPAPGERHSYEIQYPTSDDDPTVEYALVSMLPGTDGHHQILLISGLNTQATMIATEFLTDPDRIVDVVERLRAAAPRHQGPWRFQLLLNAEVRDKVPTGGSIELVRVLDL